MGFDWGGFTGGIIGTIGAFGVALYTLKNQNKKEKPAMFKRQYRLMLKVKSILVRSKIELIPFQNNSIRLNLIMLKVYEYKDLLEELLPEALEVDRDIHNSIDKFVDTIILTNDEYNRRTDEEGINEEYLKRYNELADSMISYCWKMVVYIKKVPLE